jgi:hypothetical protein
VIENRTTKSPLKIDLIMEASFGRVENLKSDTHLKKKYKNHFKVESPSDILD